MLTSVTAFTPAPAAHPQLSCWLSPATLVEYLFMVNSLWAMTVQIATLCVVGWALGHGASVAGRVFLLWGGLFGLVCAGGALGGGVWGGLWVGGGLVARGGSVDVGDGGSGGGSVGVVSSVIHLGLDTTGVVLAMLAASLLPLALLATSTATGSTTVLLLLGLSLAATCALDLLSFVILFESTAVLLYCLIGRSGDGSWYSATSIVLYTMAGSLAVLWGLVMEVAGLGGWWPDGALLPSPAAGMLPTTSSPTTPPASQPAHSPSSAAGTLTTALPPLPYASASALSRSPASTSTVTLPWPTSAPTFLSTSPAAALSAPSPAAPSAHSPTVHSTTAQSAAAAALSPGSPNSPSPATPSAAAATIPTHTLTQAPSSAAATLLLVIKLPLAPVHLWLPSAHAAAPLAGSILLSGVILKLAGLMALRFLTWAAVGGGELLAAAAAATGLLGATATLRAHQLKTLVAYSSLVHMSTVGGGVVWVGETALSGAVLMLAAHGLVSPGLFVMAVGASAGAGTAAALLLSAFALANAAFPPAAGFWAELALVLSLLAAHELLAWCLILVNLLAAPTNLVMLERAVRGWGGSGGQAGGARILFSMAAPLLFLSVALSVQPTAWL